MNLRERLKKGDALFGTSIGLNNTLSAEIVANSGFDFVMIDTQHSAVTQADLLPILQVVGLAGMPAIVRTHWAERAPIMRVLDLGAAGVIAPVVSTSEQARLVAEAVHYPPLGLRSFGPIRSYYSAGEPATAPLCFVMVETAEAMENLDDIAATPGVDGIFVGPHDLALSLGLGLAHSLEPELLDAMDRIIAACRQHQLIAGCAALSIDGARTLKDHGFRFITVGADLQFIQQGAAACLNEIRSWGE